MGKSSAPQPPDPVATSKAQTDSNVNTAIANATLGNVNQRTPGGSLTYNQIGTQTVDGREIPRYEAITELSPEQQRLYASQLGVSQSTADLANQYAGRIAENTAQPFSYAGMPDAPVYDENARVAARDRIVARQEPQFDRQREALRTQLANSGITVGSDAWNDANRSFGSKENDYYLGADAASGAEAGRIFGLQGDQRTRAIQEAQLLRTQPINEVSALLGTGPGVQQPNFVNTPQPQVQGTDVAGNINHAYDAELAAWQQQQQSQNSMLGSLFGLGGSALGGWALGGFGGLGGGGGAGSMLSRLGMR